MKNIIVHFYSLCSHNYLDQLIPSINGAKKRRFRTIFAYLLFSNEPQIVHIQFLIKQYEFFILLFLCRIKKVPLVWTPHDIKPEHNLSSSYFFLNFFLRSVDLIIVLSKHDKKLFMNMKISPSKIKIIALPNTNFYRSFIVNKSIACSKLKLSPDKLIFFQFGPILFYKGFDISAESFSLLPENMKKRVCLVFAGKILDKKYFAGFPTFINRAWCLKDRYLTNKEIGLLYSAADVVLYPYREINQSGALFDAFAFGKPVIASKIGGIPEVIKNNKEGLLIKPDTKSLLSGMKFFIKYPQKYKTMAQNSLKKGDCLSWKEIADQHTKFYESLVK